MMLALRAALFYTAYAASTVVWASLAMLVCWMMPLPMRHWFVVGLWTRFVLWWLRVTCGIRVDAQGIENIPATPCIFFVKHQSTWETLWVQTLRSPQVTLVKRELLRIPFWGWAYSLLRSIAIDRDNPRQALRQLVDGGTDRLADGADVTLFPEGTRIPPGQTGRFHRGVAALAIKSGAPIVLIAHNAGHRWPPRKFIKQPGTIAVRIADPISTEGRKANEIMEICADRMKAMMAGLEP